MKKIALFPAVFCIIICISCCRQDKGNTREKTQIKTVENDSLQMYMIADTIIYDVIIKNAYPENAWAERCIKNLNRTELVDQLFDAVYNEKAIAYDFFSGKKLKPSDLKKIERDDDFNRAKIGKLQFTERWYYNPSDLVLQKKIISIVLGYELSGNDGQIIGYKPAFKINMN